MRHTPSDWTFVVLSDLKVVIANDGVWCDVQGLFAEAKRCGHEVFRASRAKAIAMSANAEVAFNLASYFGPRVWSDWRLPSTSLFIHQGFWGEWLEMCGLPSKAAADLVASLSAAIDHSTTGQAAEASPSFDHGRDVELDQVALTVLQSLLVAGNIPRRYGAPNGYDHVASAYAIAEEVMRFRSGERTC